MKIEETSYKEARVQIINSIKKKYKGYRQDSKACTFALTYAGTHITLQKNFGFTEDVAKHIEAQYHELYKVSDEFISNKLTEASQKGYATVAFGLRVRCHKMYQTILGDSKTPREAEAEKRTIGNALGQSYGLLNSRAGVEAIKAINNSPYRYSILPAVHIHDAEYFMVQDNAEIICWLNDVLQKAVSYCPPELYYKGVPLGGELSLFYPDEAHELEVPPNCTPEKLYSLVAEYMKNL